MPSLIPATSRESAELAGEVAMTARAGEITNSRLGGATFEKIPRDAPVYGEVQGVRVRAVECDSLAWANGLRPGDIITSVNQRAVSELKDFYELVNWGNQRCSCMCCVATSGSGQ